MVDFKSITSKLAHLGPKPLACVWELTPIWHERNAWTRYLYSASDIDAKPTYLQDQLSGIA